MDRVIFTFCLLLFLTTSHASRCEARDYYVSNAGNDLHEGTEEQPWKSLDQVNRAHLQPGDRVLLEEGHSFLGTLRLEAEDSGSEAKKLTVGSFGSGRAIIEAGDSTGLAADRCDHLVIKDLVFRGSGRNNGSNGSGIELKNCSHVEVTEVEASGFRMCGVRVDGVRHVRITHVHAHDNGLAGIASGVRRTSEDLYVGYCTAENNPGDPLSMHNHSGNGIVIGQAKNVVVEYCVARNNGWDMPRRGNGPVGIWSWNTDNILIQHCISRDNKSPGQDGGGFDFDGGTTNGILQYNLSYNNDGPGYLLCQYALAPPLKNNIIRYNISQNDGRKNNRRTGIDIFAANTLAEGCQIYNNTIYNEHGAAIGFGGLPIRGVVLKNNIFVTTNPPIRGDYSHARFEGNLWWTLGESEFQLGDFRGLRQWAEATGQEKIGDRFVGHFADPRWGSAGAVDCQDPKQLTAILSYRLRTDSPCLGAGLPITSHGERDFWGHNISANQPVNIGAYQEAGEKILPSGIKKNP